MSYVLQAPCLQKPKNLRIVKILETKAIAPMYSYCYAS